jgi:putative transposon-encoded protein
MVLYQKCVRRFGPSTKMVPTAELSGLKGRTQFWKGITQGSFQQSLVEIGSVVSEENINNHWMVLFLKCVRRFGPSTKMALTAELSLT